MIIESLNLSLRGPLAALGGNLDLVGLDYIVLAGYVCLLLAIGGWVSFRHHNSEDFFLGGRSMKWGNIGFSIFGTNIGPTFLIASCGAGYTTGIVNANYEWMAWIFLCILGMAFVPFYLRARVQTMPEFLYRRFDLRAYRFMTGYSLFGTVVLWIGGTLYAGGALLAQLLGWEILSSIWLLAFLSTVFTVAGGLRAVMVTDSFQSVLIIIGAGVLTVSALLHLDSFAALRAVEVSAVAPELTWKLFHPSGSATPWYAFVLGLPVLSLWFWCFDQTIVQRALGAKNLAQSQGGTLFCAFLKILPPFIFILPGILAAVLLPGIEDDKAVFLTMVDAYLGPGLKGLIVAVLVASVVSTLNSGLNSFSTVFTLDVINRLRREPPTATQTRIAGMVTTSAAALLAVGIAVYLQHAQEKGGLNLFDLFQSIIGYMAPPVSTVFVLGIFWRRATATAAFLTLVVGSVVCLGLGLSVTVSPDTFILSDGSQLLPHFLLQSFGLFVLLCVFMVVASLLTAHRDDEEALPSLIEAYREHPGMPRNAALWGWGSLALCMAGLYAIF